MGKIQHSSNSLGFLFYSWFAGEIARALRLYAYDEEHYVNGRPLFRARKTMRLKSFVEKCQEGK